jgi:hypothetical protein
MSAIGSRGKARQEQEEAAFEGEERLEEGEEGKCVAFILDRMDQYREWHHSDQATRDERRS